MFQTAVLRLLTGRIFCVKDHNNNKNDIISMHGNLHICINDLHNFLAKRLYYYNKIIDNEYRMIVK